MCRSRVHIVVEPDIILKDPESTTARKSKPHSSSGKEHESLSLKLPRNCPAVVHAVHATSDSTSGVLSNMAQDLSREQPLLMECEVKLERITNQDQPNLPNDIEFALENIRSVMGKSYECDICSRRFALLSDLWEHAMACMPASLRDEESGEGVITANKKVSIFLSGMPVLRECTVTLNQLAHHAWPRTNDFAPNATLKRVLQQPSASHARIASETIRKNATKYTLLPTGERLYTCEICAKEFTVARNLNKHKRTHTGVKPFSCEVCQRKFSQACNLKTHLLIHSEVKRFSCDKCELKFTQLGNLKRHLSRAHTRAQYYSCEICKKKFTELVTLEKHSETHAGVKTFSCDVCNKKFTQKGNMETHKRIHTGDKPFSCGVCHRDFTALSNLLRHKPVHKTLRLYECGVCNKSFKRLDHLKTHMQIHTGLNNSHNANGKINVKKNELTGKM